MSVTSRSAWRATIARRSRASSRCWARPDLQRPQDLKPWFVMKRVSAMDVRSYADIYPQLTRGQLLASPATTGMSRAWENASASHF